MASGGLVFERDTDSIHTGKSAVDGRGDRCANGTLIGVAARRRVQGDRYDGGRAAQVLLHRVDPRDDRFRPSHCTSLEFPTQAGFLTQERVSGLPPIFSRSPQVARSSDGRRRGAHPFGNPHLRRRRCRMYATTIRMGWSGGRLVEADATALSDPGPFDAVVVLEALHDLARPVERPRSACAGRSRTAAAPSVVDERWPPGSPPPATPSNDSCTAGASVTVFRPRWPSSPAPGSVRSFAKTQSAHSPLPPASAPRRSSTRTRVLPGVPPRRPTMRPQPTS